MKLPQNWEKEKYLDRLSNIDQKSLQPSNFNTTKQSVFKETLKDSEHLTTELPEDKFSSQSFVYPVAKATH